MRENRKKNRKIFIYVSLNSFSLMANRTEKAFTTFVAFESPEAKKMIEEKKALEFPTFTTATGKCKLHRLIKWEQTTYKGRDMEIPVVACDCARSQKQIELAKFFGKEKVFVIDRESGNFKKGDKFQIDNLVGWLPELQGRTSARNEAIMNAITEGLEVTLVTLWGHYDEEGARSFNLTLIEEGAKKL
jgi:hypothetical protein